MIHPDFTPDHLDAMTAFIAQQEQGIDPELFADLDLPITKWADQVVSVPLLSPEFCDFLVDTAGTATYSPNMAEQERCQIKEVVLHPNWPITKQINGVMMKVAWPILQIMFGRLPVHFASTQLARYDADISGTDWHHDEQSDFTITVSLAPERCTGGGTGMLPGGGFGPYTVVPSLPKGHALLFNGRSTLHRGLQIKEGTRNLLVCWCL